MWRKSKANVHKSNVFKIGDGMFLDICREAANGYPGLAVDDILVDAMMAHVVRNPERFDVIVSTNMFGEARTEFLVMISLHRTTIGSSDVAGTLGLYWRARHRPI